MLLVFFNAVVMGLLVVTIIQGYEIKNLKSKIEKKYKIQFNFDDNFLTFPNFKSEGKFSDLTF